MTELPRSARLCMRWGKFENGILWRKFESHRRSQKTYVRMWYRRLQRVRCRCEQSKIAFNFSNGLNMAQAIRIVRCIAWNATYLVDWLTSKPYDDILMRSPFCTNSRTHTDQMEQSRWRSGEWSSALVYDSANESFSPNSNSGSEMLEMRMEHTKCWDSERARKHIASSMNDHGKQHTLASHTMCCAVRKI